MTSQYNPTAYFFKQSENPPDIYRKQIDEFVAKLINLNQCVLCKKDYSLQPNRIPRILVHCGHTFCTDCLLKFHKNFRIRCPLCLKLIKNIESIDRIPINHTIFTNLATEYNQQNQGKEQINIQQALYEAFLAASTKKNNEMQYDPNFNQIPPQMVNQLIQQQEQILMSQGLQSKPKLIQINNLMNEFDKVQLMKVSITDENNLPMCEYHGDRIKHFFCITHKTYTCRMCTQMMHNKEECMIVDIFEAQDMQRFLIEAYKFDPQVMLTLQQNISNKEEGTFQDPNQREFHQMQFANQFDQDQEQYQDFDGEGDGENYDDEQDYEDEEDDNQSTNSI